MFDGTEGYISRIDELGIPQISFTVTGTVSTTGIVRLQETHSFSSGNIVIPTGIENMNTQSVLSFIMEHFNAKLRTYVLGEHITRSY